MKSKDDLRNLADGVLRRIKRKRRALWQDITNVDIENLLTQYNLVHQSSWTDEKRELLDECLAKLDQEHFDIVTMYWYSGKNLAEISEIYGHNNREWARAKLKRAYEIMRRVS